MIALAPIVRGSISCFLALLCAACTPTIRISELKELPQQQPLVRYTVAHRGSLHSGLPDNSIPALQDAIKRGVTFLELDVRRSTAGDLFLFHDGSLQEGNFSSPPDLLGRPVQELSLAGRSRVRLDAEGRIPIPTFEEALRILPPRGVALQVDLKGESDALLGAVLELLKKERALSRVVIQLRDPERIKQTRLAAPQARILARCTDAAQLTQALDAKVEFVELERWITAEAIQKAHQAKIPVLINVAASPYDEREIWEILRARGVDSIMTNRAVEAQSHTLVLP